MCITKIFIRSEGFIAQAPPQKFILQPLGFPTVFFIAWDK